MAGSNATKVVAQENLEARKKAENALVKYGIPKSDPYFSKAVDFVMLMAEKYSGPERKLTAEDVLKTISKNRNPEDVNIVWNRLKYKRKTLRIVESVPKKSESGRETFGQKLYNILERKYYENLRKPEKKEELRREVKRLERVYGITRDFHNSTDPGARMILEKIR